MHVGNNTGNFSTILTTSSDVDDELLSNVIPYQIRDDKLPYMAQSLPVFSSTGIKSTKRNFSYLTRCC